MNTTTSIRTNISLFSRSHNGAVIQVSQTTQKLDDETLNRFKSAFDDVREFHTDSFRQDEVDGKVWGTKHVALFGPETTQFGDVPLDGFTDSEYACTHTIEGDKSEHRCYGFTADSHTHWVNVSFVRTLANDVFDVSYDEIKSWAQTNADEPLEDYDDRLDQDENNGMVIFDIPDSEWGIVIAPVSGPDDVE